MTVQQITDGNPDGALMGRSDDLIAFLGNTAIAQQTAGTAAPEIDPTTSGSTLVASIHSIAIGAASLANVNAQVLASFGFTS